MKGFGIRVILVEPTGAEQPPLRIFFGEGPLEMITKEYQARLDEWRAWDQVSRSTFGS
ncbi:hypothetical protein [Streptomyces sp. NPDC001642]|uniref:hypothetical protein n=1 Tax=Streptomyces sp. NPDC001642 TaxID=3154392 RepID=UPI00332C38C1